MNARRAKPIGLVITVLDVYCNQCRSIFFRRVPGVLRRVAGRLVLRHADGRQEVFTPEPCHCGSRDLWLRESL
jgi:hypothetical protein